MYEYKCVILRVVDGISVDVDIDLGFDIWMHNERIRLFRTDTPETRTSDEVEKILKNFDKDYVEKIMPVGSEQILKTLKDADGKYARILGDFIVDDKSLVEKMVQESFQAGQTNETNS